MHDCFDDKEKWKTGPAENKKAPEET